MLKIRYRADLGLICGRVYKRISCIDKSYWKYSVSGDEEEKMANLL